MKKEETKKSRKWERVKKQDPKGHPTRQGRGHPISEKGFLRRAFTKKKGDSGAIQNKKKERKKNTRHEKRLMLQKTGGIWTIYFRK